MPFMHVAPLGQANMLPQPPQLLSSAASLTQAPLHEVYGLLQVNPQVVPLHVAVPFVGAVHTVQLGPHAPTPSATHDPPHDSVPVGHWHMLVTHCLPPVHDVPQPPQLLLSLVSSTQAPLQVE